ncbi:MAG TPA: glycosyltransferase family 4 protein [Candidatus Nanopelagicales bacterium]|nr:glycosyltransferase family 4 protein [Candidatus Nanopelagicales bacterium]
MKVALVAPPWYRVPPRAYGGIESLVAGLADGLAARGPEVLLVAAGPSSTLATTTRQTFDEAAETSLGDESISLLHGLHVEDALHDFAPDVVHDHTLPGLLAARRRPWPTIATAHGPVVGGYGELLERGSRDVAMVAISSSQRGTAPQVRWHSVVHNGVPVAAYPFERTKKDRLVFLGRMHPDKGVVEAIDVAERAGVPLLIAARMHGDEEEAYFREMVKPRLTSTIEYAGELSFDDKTRELATARALLFPLQWREPYGLVVAEAQACGTPVLSLRRGAIPELVREGITGFLGEHHLDLVPLVERVGSLSPDDCRTFARRHLDISRTVKRYESVFADVCGTAQTTQPRRIPQPTTLVDLRATERDGHRLTTGGAS